MPLTLKIAFLNILRNKRRTFITLLAIMVGCICIILYGGYINTIFEAVKESTIRSHYGHIQIFKKGYEEFGKNEPENYLLSSEMIEKIMEVIDEEPEILVATRRLDFGGLLSNGNASAGAFGIGIEPDNEVDFSANIKILEGEDLFPEDEENAIIGQAMAKSLGAKIGDNLTMMSGTVDGSVNAVNLVVGGIITTGRQELDKRYLKANLPHIQSLIDSESVTRLLILLKETDKTDIMRAKLEKAFADANLDIEMKTWSEMADLYHQLVEYYTQMFIFITIVIVFIVVLGIANTMTMVVLERTKEIGTIRALGNTRSQIVKLFLSEALYLGVIGGIMGIIAGVFIAKWITSLMIMQAPPPGSTVAYPYSISVVPTVLIQAFALGVIASVISSIYPAVKASQLKIVDALRHI